MMCAMCESHVNDAVRRALRVKSVRSSRAKNETVVLAEQALDEAALRDAIAATGYEVGGVTRQQAQKRLLGWRGRGGLRGAGAGGGAMALPYRAGRTSRSTVNPQAVQQRKPVWGPILYRPGLRRRGVPRAG